MISSLPSSALPLPEIKLIGGEAFSGDELGMKEARVE
jgi:hypothetical protein